MSNSEELNKTAEFIHLAWCVDGETSLDSIVDSGAVFKINDKKRGEFFVGVYKQHPSSVQGKESRKPLSLQECKDLVAQKVAQLNWNELRYKTHSELLDEVAELYASQSRQEQGEQEEVVKVLDEIIEQCQFPDLVSGLIIINMLKKYGYTITKH